MQSVNGEKSNELIREKEREKKGEYIKISKLYQTKELKQTSEMRKHHWVKYEQNASHARARSLTSLFLHLPCKPLPHCWLQSAVCSREFPWRPALAPAGWVWPLRVRWRWSACCAPIGSHWCWHTRTKWNQWSFSRKLTFTSLSEKQRSRWHTSVHL